MLLVSYPHILCSIHLTGNKLARQQLLSLLNPDLTWRNLQHLTIHNAGAVNTANPCWDKRVFSELKLQAWVDVMSLQGHTARRERKVSVGQKGVSVSMVRWFRGGLNDQV